MQPTKTLFLFLLALLRGVAAADDEEPLTCYTCTMVAGDDSCLNDPANAGATPTVDCLYGEDQCCLIQRIDSKEDLGTPVGLARLCTVNCDPKLIGKMVETEDYNTITYQTYCDDYLCNNGPGNVPPGSNSGGGNYIGGIAGDAGGAAVVEASALVMVAGVLAATRR